MWNKSFAKPLNESYYYCSQEAVYKLIWILPCLWHSCRTISSWLILQMTNGIIRILLWKMSFCLPWNFAVWLLSSMCSSKLSWSVLYHPKFTMGDAKINVDRTLSQQFHILQLRCCTTDRGWPRVSHCTCNNRTLVYIVFQYNLLICSSIQLLRAQTCPLWLFSLIFLHHVYWKGDTLCPQQSKFEDYSRQWLLCSHVLLCHIHLIFSDIKTGRIVSPSAIMFGRAWKYSSEIIRSC